MKKLRTLYLIVVILALGAIQGMAQTITAPEPDNTSADLVYYVTPQGALQAMPLETGEIKEHKNKLGQIAAIASNVGGITRTAGNMAISAGVATGVYRGMMTSLSVAVAGIRVQRLAEAVDNLAGAEGKDFTYEGPTAKTVLRPTDSDLKMLLNLRCEDKITAMNVIKVVRFKATKSDRRLRWQQTKAALIGTDKSSQADKAGYLSFGYSNYGDHSSVITIPASQLQKGEYGIFFLGNMFTTPTTIMCYTFTVS